MTIGKPARRGGCLKLFGLLMVFNLVAGGFLFYWVAPYGRDHLNVVIPKGRSLVEAVESYRTKHGRLPERLEDLVPGFLEAVPPADSIPGCRVLTYRKKSPDHFTVEMTIHLREKIWYDSSGEYTENWGTFETRDGWAYTSD